MSHKTPPVICCVGGSDPSAHAGLQADMRTGLDLGVHVQTIVTCVSAQNSLHVEAVEAVSEALFDQQWQTLLADRIPEVIKVSLLPNDAITELTQKWLRYMSDHHPAVKILFDPVMSASSKHGARLQQETVRSLLFDRIVPYVDWVMPNLDESAALLNLSGNPDLSSITQALSEHITGTEQHWLIKGGHADDVFATDWLIQANQQVGFQSPRLDVTHNRGTGCTLSTALAAFIALGYDDLDAYTLAKAYLNGALANARQIGQGAGPLGVSGWPKKRPAFPEILPRNKPLNGAFAAIDRDKFGLYPVMDSVEWLERVLQQGVKTAQLRIKDPNAPDLDEQIKRAVALGEQYHAQVFINDYWRKAMEFGAYGVHLGQEDLDEADLQSIQQAGLRLGISTHGYYEIMRAMALSPSYIALGHIFPTQTKDMPSQPQGLARLKDYVSLIGGRIPTVAIGGISTERASAVLDTQVDTVAVVSAITKAEQPEQATLHLIDLVQSKERFHA